MLNKIHNFYRRHPNLCVALGAALAGIAIVFPRILLIVVGYAETGEFVPLLLVGWMFGAFVFYPLTLTVWNIWQFVSIRYQKEFLKAARITDVATMLWGAVCVFSYMKISDVRMADWTETLVNQEVHTPIATWTVPTIVTIAVVACLGYLILRFLPLKKLPPLLSVLAMAAMYLGIGLCILFIIQLFGGEFILAVYPLNLLLVLAKTVRQVCMQQERARQFSGLAFLLMWPLLGVVTVVLILFGQKPNSLIEAFTQTSDWTLSLQKAPPNVFYDEHYLCTVAAGGHPKVVKPLRMGERRGHRIVVNRQLLVANAFEDLLEERLPGVHRRLRQFYDTFGYPIARHIKSRFTADLVYLLMKPLEYFFVIVLYLFDTAPEDRIAVQYLGADLSAVRRTV